ncbi:hypothetical protein GCM10009839_51340 [Catenulispora yoronensis]|uniref:Uncharacterized protein n=1 Tax=Catenulispora yoronensis TaxID=450799 RepID=A0ABN2URQ5_9ACTN
MVWRRMRHAEWNRNSASGISAATADSTEAASSGVPQSRTMSNQASHSSSVPVKMHATTTTCRRRHAAQVVTSSPATSSRSKPTQAAAQALAGWWSGRSTAR